MEEPGKKPVRRPKKRAAKKPILRNYRMACWRCVTIHDSEGHAIQTFRYGTMPAKDVSFRWMTRSRIGTEGSQRAQKRDELAPDPDVSVKYKGSYLPSRRNYWDGMVVNDYRMFIHNRQEFDEFTNIQWSIFERLYNQQHHWPTLEMVMRDPKRREEIIKKFREWRTGGPDGDTGLPRRLLKVFEFSKGAIWGMRTPEAGLFEHNPRGPVYVCDKKLW